MNKSATTGEHLDINLIDTIVDSHGCKQSAVISILQEVQDYYRYLPMGVFTHLSKRLKMSRARIYSVATFYENFSLEAKGKYLIKVCDGTACHVRKSIPILERLHKETGTTYEKKTTDDKLFTVETVSCLGACGLAPVITVNDKVYPAMTPESTTELVKTLKEEAANDA